VYLGYRYKQLGDRCRYFVSLPPAPFPNFLNHCNRHA
jgi:hypothetical protein